MDQAVKRRELSRKSRRKRKRKGGSEIIWRRPNLLEKSVAIRRSMDAPLAEHYEWWGPSKLVRTNTAHAIRTEIFVARRVNESLWNAEAATAEDLVRDLDNAVFSRKPSSSPPSWTPPGAEKLKGWLSYIGVDTTEDDQGDLHAVLKRKDREGELRITFGAGRLRFTLPLASGSNLEAEAKPAMMALAQACNDTVRLIRIGWGEEGPQWRFDAIADLTGLPTGDDYEAMWRLQVQFVCSALVAAMLRLSRELRALADPAQEHLRAAVVGHNGRPRRAK